ncbi:hypothetical protein INR49_013052 [Caranx melampygus]|nr:hypothetical protein INR49_013052 [Caranx melampygus]
MRHVSETDLSMMKSVRVAVVGGGVVGFSTAVCIAEALPLCSVTLLAEKFSPDTTSDGAAGLLFAAPFPDIPLERQKCWFKDSFDHLLAIARSEHSPEAGMTDRELNQFPDHKFGQAFTTIKCECSTYLPWLERRFRKAGGQVQQRRVNSLQELSSSYDMIVNCSGLGAKQLVGDTQIYPVRGQVLKVEAPWLQHFIRDGDGMTYIYPGIHNWAGLRPTRRNPRVEREVVQLQGHWVPVVHNYGHGGWGSLWRGEQPWMHWGSSDSVFMKCVYKLNSGGLQKWLILNSSSYLLK